MIDKDDSTRTLRNTKSVPKWLSEAEERAQKLVDEFAPLCAKLKDLKPEIEKVKADFKKVKGSQTILGCRHFKEFCEKKLNRKEQTVYAMLGDYSQKPKKGGSPRSKPDNSAAHPSLTLSDEDVERMRTGLNAVARARAAEAVGDKAKSDEAWQEYEAISQAESLKSVIFGDQPSYKLLLVQLLGVIEQVGDKVPMMLINHCRAIRKRIGIDDASFGLETADRKPPHSAPPAAQGAREVSIDSFGDLSIPMEKPEQAQTAQALG